MQPLGGITVWLTLPDCMATQPNILGFCCFFSRAVTQISGLDYNAFFSKSSFSGIYYSSKTDIGNTRPLSILKQCFTASCEDLTAEVGSTKLLTSPGWPDLYRNNESCEWTIKAPEGHMIEFEVDAFDTELCCDTLQASTDNIKILINKSVLCFIKKN